MSPFVVLYFFSEEKMILITCVDDNLGMAFNHRRQSRDRNLTSRLLEFAQTASFWTDPYSATLFGKSAGDIRVDGECLSKAGKGEFCFVEILDPSPYEDRFEKIILFRWNRVYPVSLKLGICLEGWEKTITREFAGYSHEKITEEDYERC